MSLELFVIRHGQSSNNALEDVSERVKDPHLTNIGERQIEHIGPFLAEGLHLVPGERNALTSGPPASSVNTANLDELYCSPMWRCLQTVKPVAESLGMVPRVWVDIHEQGGIYLDHGEERGVVGYPGATRGEIEEAFPGYVLPDAIDEDGWWRGGCEEVEKCHERAVGVAKSLLHRADAVYRADDSTQDHRERPADQVAPPADPAGRRGVRVGLVSHGGFMDAMLKAFGRLPSGNGLAYSHNNTGITRIDLRGDGDVDVRYVNRVTHLPSELIT